MIRIDQFINVIHSAVLSANEALMQENLNLLNTYFEDSDEADEMKASLDHALDSIDDVVSQGKPSREALQKAMKAFQGAKEALQDENKPKGTAKTPNTLKAKTVALQFPDQTSNGTVMRNIHVPLISLIPVSMAQVSEVKFRTNLEMQVENEDLLVGFPTPKAASTPSSEGDSGQPNGAFIEITITPQESSEGLKKLIEGYEKVLRSQMPN